MFEATSSSFGIRHQIKDVLSQIPKFSLFGLAQYYTHTHTHTHEVVEEKEKRAAPATVTRQSLLSQLEEGPFLEPEDPCERTWLRSKTWSVHGLRHSHILASDSHLIDRISSCSSKVMHDVAFACDSKLCVVSPPSICVSLIFSVGRWWGKVFFPSLIQIN